MLPECREFCKAIAFVKCLDSRLELKDDKNKEVYYKQDCLLESIAIGQAPLKFVRTEVPAYLAIICEQTMHSLLKLAVL